VPDPSEAGDEERCGEYAAALEYMGLQPGMALEEIAIDRVFIGSCTNSRIEDLRAALRWRSSAKPRCPRGWCPGSRLVQKQAEREGLDRIFRSAGFEWREPGARCVPRSTAISCDRGNAVPRPRTAIFAADRERAGARTS
jgi:3-isopropylmalate/(R)-2-methylmalate dehydratase large subunit